jgi:hypothetical protein
VTGLGEEESPKYLWPRMFHKSSIWASLRALRFTFMRDIIRTVDLEAMSVSPHHIMFYNNRSTAITQSWYLVHLGYSAYKSYLTVHIHEVSNVDTHFSNRSSA